MARANAYNEDSLVNREFGIQVVDDLTSVDARILPAPMVIMCLFFFCKSIMVLPISL